MPVQVRIVESDPNNIKRTARRLIRAAQRRYRIAESLARKDQFAFRVPHSAIECVDGFQLRRRKAGRVVLAVLAWVTKQFREVHFALTRVVQESFLECAAGVHDHLIHQSGLLRHEVSFRMT